MVYTEVHQAIDRLIGMNFVIAEYNVDSDEYGDAELIMLVVRK